MISNHFIKSIYKKKIKTFTFRNYSIVRLNESLLHNSNNNEVTLYIKGFLAKGESRNDFNNWFNSHQKLVESKGWGQDAIGFNWKSGEIPFPVPIFSAGLLVQRLLKISRLHPMGIVTGIAGDLAIHAGLLINEYHEINRNTEKHAKGLREQLKILKNEHSRVRVVAHSMGCRVLLHALSCIKDSSIPDEIHLCAPAVTHEELDPNLNDMANDFTAIYTCPRDFILSILYPGITGGYNALGTACHPPEHLVNLDKVKHINVDSHFGYFVHTEYQNKFHEFAI